MNSWHGGKGSAARKRQVSRSEYDRNYERIFGGGDGPSSLSEFVKSDPEEREAVGESVGKRAANRQRGIEGGDDNGDA